MMGETRQRRSSSQILVLVPRRGELFIRAGACQFRREGIKNHIEQRLVHTDAPVVFDKTVLAKAIHEETDAGSGVPIISARASCVISGIRDSGSPGFPNSASNKRILASRFSLELKS